MTEQLGETEYSRQRRQCGKAQSYKRWSVWGAPWLGSGRVSPLAGDTTGQTVVARLRGAGAPREGQGCRAIGQADCDSGSGAGQGLLKLLR